MRNQLDTSTPVVVLRSESHGGLNIMRSLGRLGVPVHNIDPNPWAPAFQSRYCSGRFLWDIEHRTSEESLDYLSDVRRKIGRRSILIPTTDRTARFVANHADELAGDFLFPRQPSGLVDSLADKKQMFFLARQHNIPTPGAAFPSTREDVLAFLDKARFPVMLKGIDGQQLHERIGRKMFIVRSKDELLGIYNDAEDPGNPNLMLQEYIPGGDDTVWMFNGYFNAHSDCVVGFTGRKLRQCPIHKGCTSLGICLMNDIVKETTVRFMKAVGYRGTLDIGYRYDERDDQYKVLDVNPRIGATFRLFVGENGVDVARALYLDLTGQEVVPSPAKEGRKWIVEDLDLVSSYRYRHEGTLRFGEWLRSFRGIDEAAFMCCDDPLPILPMLVGRAKELLRRLFSARLAAFLRRGSSLSQPVQTFPEAGLTSQKPVFDSFGRKTHLQ